MRYERFGVPVIALHQLSRRTEHRANKLPGLADLRDSGHVEQDADVVLLLYREGYYDNESDQAKNQSGLCVVNIAKHRDGPTGKVELWFDASLALFKDIERKREEK
jgi:replicative DNA helicase